MPQQENRGRDQLTYKAGEVICLEGERPDGIYILKSGEVEVLKGSRVIALIKEQESFFGEMSYLMQRRRTSSLRAKTEVRLVKIDLEAAGGLDVFRKMPEKFFELMKSLAVRLDITNNDLLRCHRNDELLQRLREKARVEDSRECLALIETVDGEMKIAEKAEEYGFLQAYLLTPRVWNLVKNAFIYICKFYLYDTPQLLDIADDRGFPEDMPVASWIGFHGEKKGGIALFMPMEIARAAAKGFGVEAGGRDDAEDVVRELSNQILGQIKIKVSSFFIDLETPRRIGSREDYEKLLCPTPVLAMTFSLLDRKVRLAYQYAL